MNRSRLNARRLAALAAGTLIGITGALVATAPAAAHSSLVSGKCIELKADGSWVVQWSVKNNYTAAGTITKADASVSAPIDGIAAGKTIEKNSKVSGQQVIPYGTTEAMLTTKLSWPDHFNYPESGDKVSNTHCAKTPEGVPTAVAKATCTQLEIVITNGTGKPVTVRLEPTSGEAKEIEVAPGVSPPQSFPAADKLAVLVKIGKWSETYTYTKPTTGCDTPPSPALPVTGVKGSIAAGVAVLLLAAGAVLFVVARRRRIR